MELSGKMPSQCLFTFQLPLLTVFSIDNLDVSKIGVSDLRGRLAIIPQDPAMFEGTLRDNLDPRHVHDDTALWSALGTIVFFFLNNFSKLPGG